MGLILNGNAPSKMIYNGAEVSLYFNGSKIWPAGAPTPILPANTVRVRTSNGNPPNKGSKTTYETATLVPGTTDIYDVYKSGTDFSYMLYYSSNVVEIIAANTSNVTNMKNMFSDCNKLTTVPLFDTSSVTNMAGMFYNCKLLTLVPLFDTSNVTDMSSTFCYCNNVQSGALALYQQASTQANPPTNHSYTFRSCGRDTTTGAAELAQIPTSWGGTMS